MGSIRAWLRDPSIHIPLLIFGLVRLFTLILAFGAVKFGGPITNPYIQDRIFIAGMGAVNPNGPFYPLIEPWQRWDTGWYLKVASQGYAAGDGSVIFAPLYPAVSRLTGLLVGDTLFGALIVSSVAGALFLIILYKLAYLDSKDHTVARNTLLALIAFPTAFYLMAAYTESLFLAFTAGAILAARHKRWWIAAILAAGSSLTRLQGWVLFFPIGWLAFAEAPRFWGAVVRDKAFSFTEKIRCLLPDSVPRLAAMGGGPLMTATFLLYLPLAGFGSISDAYDKYWALIVRPPWSVVIDVIAKIGAGRANLTEFAGFVALLIIFAMTIISLRVLPIVYQFYLWPTLMLILLRYYPLYLLNGTMRYVLDFFPIFIAAGVLATQLIRRRRLVPRLALIGLLVVGINLEFIMLYLFVRWMWIA